MAEIVENASVIGAAAAVDADFAAVAVVVSQRNSGEH